MSNSLLAFYDKETGKLEDVCEVVEIQTWTMSPLSYKLYLINMFINPFYDGIEGYRSLVEIDGNYHSSAKKHYRCVAITEDMAQELINELSWNNFGDKLEI